MKFLNYINKNWRVTIMERYINKDGYESHIFMGIKRLTYKGIPVSQVVGVEDKFSKLLNNEEFDVIIEIGTLHGGLTLVLSDLFNGHIYSYDINKVENKALLKENITLVLGDVFSNTEIYNIIKNNRVLVLCDGGNKIKEVNHFAKYIKPNDYIMAHDYFHLREEFSSDKWTGCEITYADIKTECEKNNIENTRNFEDVFWYCGRKKEI